MHSLRSVGIFARSMIIFMMLSAINITVAEAESRSEIEYIVTFADLPEAEDNENQQVPMNLKLFGRGIQQRGSNESIAFACYDESCSTARFVHFNGSESKWIGGIIRLPVVESEKLKKKAYELKLKEYLLKRKNIKHRSNRFSYGLGVATVLVITPVSFKAAMATGIGLTTGAFGAILIPLGIYYAIIAYSNSIDDALISTKSSTATFHQEGWNWTKKPRTISSKKFQKLLENINSPLLPLQTEEDRQQRNEIMRKIKLIQQSGVEFILE